jgi:hypothetical protein
MNRARILELSKNITLPEANVEFESDDVLLQALVDKAHNLVQNNIKIFTDDFQVLVEGGGYNRIYTETQPMGGEMYAKRNLRPALNNQLLFMLCQRNDGRLPGSVIPTPNREHWQEEEMCMWMSSAWTDLGLAATFEQFQGNALPYPAFKMYYLIGKPKEYLLLLAESIEAFDNYIWKTRDPYNEGVLQSWCEWDTGEDNSSRFGGSPTRWPHDYPPDGKNTPDPGNSEDRKRYYLWSHVSEKMEKNSVKVPIRSMDMMAYSYENRAVLAMISEELKDGKADCWKQKAETVRDSFRDNLWRPELGAAYDRDRHNNFMETLIHNNLRCMWYGLFDQEMAEEFVSRHLFNPEEFFTPFPLPSIAANDPLFQNTSDNNWSGPVQSLTWQRLIRALENYGLYSELTLLGRIFIKTIRKTGVFVQQFDPFDTESPITEEERKRDGYGPCTLAFLEYISRFAGVHVEHEHIFWSGLKDGGVGSYTQVFGENRFALKNDGQIFSVFINDVAKFTCSVGARVCTDMDGQPYQLVGIDTEKHQITFNHNSISQTFDLEPNQIIKINSL